MPRIPSAAEVPSVGAGASRLPAIRAEGADVGLAAAQGIVAAGNGLGRAGERLSAEVREKRLAQAEAATNVISHGVQLLDDARTLLDAWEADDSSPHEAARRSAGELRRLEDRRLKELSPEQQAVARAAAAGVHDGHRIRIGQRAHNSRVEALAVRTAATLEALHGQALREPWAAEQHAARGTALLRVQLDAGALTREQFRAKNNGFRRMLYAGVIQGQPAADAVADLEAGLFDKALDDAALKDFLLAQARWRLQSESAQARAGADALVEAARRGDDQPALTERTQRLMAPGEVAEIERAVERARRTRETLERLRYAPEAVLREEAARPAAGAAEGKERRRLREETRIQVEALLRERRYDPAGSVMGLPAVAEAFSAAARDPALLGDAVAARLAAQSALGLPAEERRALTRAESTELLTGLDALPPAERAAALGALGRRYGDHGSAVAATLAEAGLTPLEALLLDPASDPATRRALARLEERRRAGRPVEVPESDLIAKAAEDLIAERPH